MPPAGESIQRAFRTRFQGKPVNLGDRQNRLSGGAYRFSGQKAALRRIVRSDFLLKGASKCMICIVGRGGCFTSRFERGY